jgi:hypothetical protein
VGNTFTTAIPVPMSKAEGWKATYILSEHNGRIIKEYYETGMSQLFC